MKEITADIKRKIQIDDDRMHCHSDLWANKYFCPMIIVKYCDPFPCSYSCMLYGHLERGTENRLKRTNGCISEFKTEALPAQKLSPPTEEIQNLFLAAPDLLEACKNMYQRLRLNQGAGFQFPPPIVELMEELQAAIEKAEGKDEA